MKYTLPVLAFFILLGAGCGSPSGNPDESKQTSAQPQQEQSAAATAKVRILPAPKEAPVIGGTERDPLGEKEECIINGDCPQEGFSCIDGKCVQPQI